MDFPCTTCYQVLKRPTSLRDHNRRFHPTADEEPIKCSVCDKQFSRLNDMKRHTSKRHSVPCESVNEFLEAEIGANSQEQNKNSEPCMSIELNNEDKNYDEIENEDIWSFESSKKFDNPAINKKSTEGSCISETRADFEQCSNIESNSKDENALLSYEEMETKDIGNFESEKEIDIPEVLTESYENKFNGSNEMHINRMHNDKIPKDHHRYIDGLKDEHDILKLRETLNRHAGYIRKNADNILELLNTQNQHNDKIKKIKDFLFCGESNKKVFGCSLCSKYFSSKGSLYTHKSRYHRRSTKENVVKCEKCGDSFKNATALTIHNYRFHRSSL